MEKIDIVIVDYPTESPKKNLPTADNGKTR
jgi:hypothetical protein